MTTEHPTPQPLEAGDGTSFQIVVRGYHKRQVDDYIAQLQERISALQAELEEAHREQTAAGEGALRAGPRTYPQHERVSLRMNEILRLADEEAALAREEADRHAAAMLERARVEARGLLEAARSTAEEVLRETMRRCEEERVAARLEARRLIEPARRQDRDDEPPTGRTSRHVAAGGDHR
jgi:cell division septum initiation protein DivIVA